ncbi:MAG: hypothetical protein ACREL9_11765 [Gemmatimonadales bacterium]
MSDLLDAAAGVPNVWEPLPGIVTGGQPAEHHLAALKAAGCEVVLDIRDPMEPRPIRTPEAIRAAGLDYVNIPVSQASLNDQTLQKVRETVQGLAGKRRVFFHCGSGNRVGATLIPYLMLDQGFAEADAVSTAMRIGTRSAELIEWALDYVQRTKSP